MTKRTTAKTLALFLAFLLLCLPLSACDSKKNLPVTTIIEADGTQKELPLVTVVADEYMWQLTNLKTTIKSVPGYDQDFHVEIITLGNEPDRSNYLESMRVEMMAGKGPDLFLCDCFFGNIWGGTADEGDGPMFNFPQQMMANHIFLPLDEYMENARSLNPDKLLPQLLEVCRNDEGLMIIPLQYDFMVASVPEEQYSEPASRSRAGLMESGNPYLEFAGHSGLMGLALLDSFGQDADYSAEELTFTEEELLEVALDYFEGRQRWDSGYYKENAPEATDYLYSELVKHSSGEALRFVPTYNREGGVTALITNYAAINRNANYPEYAFRILDVIAGESQMRKNILYGWSTGMVTHTDFGGTGLFGEQNLPADAVEQYQELRDNITAVKFLTALDREAHYGIAQVCAQKGTTRADVEKAVRDSYRTMQMMLAES